MEYKNLGRSGLKVSQLSYGAWISFGNQLDVKEAKTLLQCCRDNGVNFFDNAEVYANGRAEEIMGQAIRELGWKRSDIVVSTKIFWGGPGPNDKGLSRKHIVEGTKASLKRLDMEYVDVIYCHRPDLCTPIEETVRAMNYVIDKGWAFHWGTSEWSAQQITEAWGVANRLDLVGPIVEQPEYNMFSRHKVESEYLPLYSNYGIGLTTWSPLASGVLTGKYNAGVPPESRFALENYKNLASRSLVDDVLKKVKKLKPIADELDVPLSQLAIAWCAANPNVSSVITGATKEYQIQENMKAINVIPMLTPEVMEKIDAIVQSKPKKPDSYSHEFSNRDDVPLEPIWSTRSSYDTWVMTPEVFLVFPCILLFYGSVYKYTNNSRNKKIISKLDKSKSATPNKNPLCFLQNPKRLCSLSILLPRQSTNPNTLPMEPEQQPSQETSKKAAKKEAAKAEKLRRKQEAAAASAAASGVAGVSIDGPDPLAANYGDTPLKDIQSNEVSGRVWTTVNSLTDELKDQTVLIRGRAHAIRAVGKKMAFLTVREKGFTVQCVMTVAPDLVSAQMVKYATAIGKESFIDIEGVVTVPPEAIKGASQQVEIQVRKIHCVNRAAPVLPINVEDAARSDVEIEKASEAGEQLVRVNQDTRLNYRILDLRTPANQGIFRVECQVSNLFRQFLLNEDFVEINTPKLIAGSSEGGAAVFKLDYKKQPACLAQSPQLHKQMAICGDFGRVFVVGPVFRAEDSYTHRHLCEFTGLDVEMEIKEHYSEVMDIVDRLFVGMFDKLNERCQKELEAIGKQYPFTPLKYLRKTLRLTFEEGIQMLKEAGIEVDPLGDLNTETERTLGKLVLEKYGTEFYILHRYPLAVRPFYTMPCPDSEAYSNSFDVFIRGEEIISGAQRVHVPELLESRAKECGIDVKTISTYIDAFRYGAPPHGGFGVGLERVVMLFCALDNIRKTSLFPRDPRRLEP
ncbi:hypothetical protein SSX86_012842 [Deinandra increscens subsp. villosa]|uniref:Probable voltage-gated potassium channel subunit beta n=1 Tax=Deinandra increscens subsp. villosa TaxID=3103831 RepID=A0AAP0H1V9_9ASTR